MLLEHTEHLGPLIHLVLAAALSIVYVKRHAVVILPAIMFASLICTTLQFEVHPFLLGISDFAAALIVFIAGLELDIDFLKKEKERVLMIFIVEATLMLTIFYVLASILPLYLATSLVAIMIASNEAFALELTRKGWGRLSQLGLTLSVLEDALAVFLLSVGFFTSARLSLSVEHLSFLIISTIALIVFLYFLSIPFNRLVDSIEKTDARILISILYLALLIAIAEVIGIPEALPVFIGSVMLSLHEFNREAQKAFENYFVLALIGFVASLPYRTGHRIPGTLDFFVTTAALGLILAIMAFILRHIILFFACLMGGLDVEESLALSLSLANTGEFGLVVLASLIHAGGIIPLQIVYAALFAYAFNLTLLSYVSHRIRKFVEAITRIMGAKVLSSLAMISSEADSIVRMLAEDIKFKRGLVELSFTVILVYTFTMIRKFVALPIIGYASTIFLISSFIVSLQEVFLRFSEDLRRLGTTKSAFGFIFRFIVLYLVIAPLLHSIGIELRSKSFIPLDSPITLFFILVATYTILFLAKRVSFMIIPEQEEAGVEQKVTPLLKSGRELRCVEKEGES